MVAIRYSRSSAAAEILLGAYQVWQDSGYDEVATARERASQLLKEHEVLPLASEEEKALGELIARADPALNFDLRAASLGR